MYSGRFFCCTFVMPHRARLGDSSINYGIPGLLWFPMAGHAPYGVTLGRWITKGTGRSNHFFSEFSSHHRCGFF